MVLTSDITLSGSKQVQIEGIPYFTFKLNNHNLSIYSPHLTNAVFFDPNPTGYMKSLNGGATLDYCIFRTDASGTDPYIPHIVLDGAFINNTGNVRLNDIYHGTDDAYINLNPVIPIQPIYIKDNSGAEGQNLSVTIKNINHGLSFDRFAKVLITTDAGVQLSVTGDTSWYYDSTQLTPGNGLSLESKIYPVASLHDVRVSGMTELILSPEETIKVLVEKEGKVYLSATSNIGSGGGDSSIEGGVANSVYGGTINYDFGNASTT